MTVTVVTAAAVAARTAAHLFVGRQASQLQSFVHVLLNGLLQVMQLFLRIEKSTGHRVLHEGVAMLLELGDFFPGQRERHLLFLLECLTFLNQLIVMRPGFLVPHKSVDALANGLHRGLLENDLAELTGLLHYGRFFNGRLHNQ
jgi:hypothetical protein